MRVFDEVVQRVASAGRNGKDPRVTVDLKCLDVDARVFPDLVIDKSVKPNREEFLEKSLL